MGDVTRDVNFLSSNYTNPNTNPKTLTTLTLTLTDPHGVTALLKAFVHRHFVILYGTIPAPPTVHLVTSNLINNWWINSSVCL